MALHAKMSPSRLFRILECPGSYTLAQKFPDKQSDAAAEGTLLHLAIERHLENFYKARPSCASADWPVDPDIVSPRLENEQIRAIENALEYYDKIVSTMGEATNFALEAKLSLTQYDTRLADIWGTGDVLLEAQDDKGLHLHIMDWKFGSGVFVDVNNNDQLLAYAAGAAINPELLRQYATINIHVVQPRMDNYACETRTPAQVMSWINGRLLPGVDAALSQNPAFNPGPKQCQWCLAKSVCRARYTKVQSTAVEIFAAHAKLPNQISLAEISKFLKQADNLVAMIKDLKKYAASALQQGKEVPGFKMVKGRNSRHWISVDAAIDYLIDNNIEEEEMYEPQSFISVAAAEKLAKKFKKDKDFVALIETKGGNPSMVSEDSPKKALVYKSAAEAFKNVEK